MPPSQPHARAAAVLVDEFDSALFQRRPDFLYRFSSATQLTLG
jgi:hypothetical protein